MSEEARNLLELTAKAVLRGEMSQEYREKLDDWIIDRDKEASQNS